MQGALTTAVPRRGQRLGREAGPSGAAIAWLFIIGAGLFVLGSAAAYVNAVGTADSVTYFVGSIFFTAASFAQLLQSQTPAMTDVDAESQYLAQLSDLGPGCLAIAIGSQPSPSFPARCVSTSASRGTRTQPHRQPGGPAHMAP